MSLAESLNKDLEAEGTKSNGGRPCLLGNALALMSEEDRTAIVEAIGNRQYSLATLDRVLAKNGVPVNVTGLSKHRNNGCKKCSAMGYEF